MKKTLSVLLSILMVLTLFLPAYAADSQPEQDPPEDGYTWSYDEETKTLSFSGSGALPDFENAFDGGEPETSAIPWYAEAKDAEHLVIGEGITAVGAGNFMLMPYLQDVSFPDSLTSIGSSAFMYDASLSSAALPPNLTELGTYAFAYNALTEVALPAGVRTLESCYLYEPLLTRIVLNEGLETVTDSFIMSSPEELTVPASVSAFSSVLRNTRRLVNRSETAVVTSCIYGSASDIDYDVLMAYLRLMARYQALIASGITEEDAAAYEQEMTTEITAYVSAHTDPPITGEDEALAYLQDQANAFSTPAEISANDVQIYCTSTSAEHAWLTDNGFPHYLSDRDNEPAGFYPHGKAGDTIRWALDEETGVLTLTGSGGTYDRDACKISMYADQVKEVRFEAENGEFTGIGKEFFAGMTQLESLTVPEGVIFIGDGFIRNSGVRTLHLPATLTGYGLSEGALALDGTPLETITVTEGSDYAVENGALYQRGSNVVRLRKMTAAGVSYPISASTTEIAPYAFEGLAMPESFTIPAGVGEVWSNAFTDLPSLKTIRIENSDNDLYIHRGICGRGTALEAYEADADDTRFSITDGVLYTGDGAYLVAVPTSFTSLTISEACRGIMVNGDAFVCYAPLSELTVLNPDFNFRDHGLSDVYADQNTLIRCQKESTALSFAIKNGCPIELLNGVTVTDVSFDASRAQLEYEIYTTLYTSNIDINPVIWYSDGTSSTLYSSELSYELHINGSVYTYAYTFTQPCTCELWVSYGNYRQVYQITVGMGNIAGYEIDLSGLQDTVNLYERISPDELGMKITELHTDGTEPTEIPAWMADFEVFADGSWTYCSSYRTFSEPGDVRLRVKYRDACAEFTLHVVEDLCITLDDSAAMLNIEQYTNLPNGNGLGMRVVLSRNGEQVCEPIVPHYSYRNECDGYRYDTMDTLVAAEYPVTFSCDYSETDANGKTHYYSKSFGPYTVSVLPGRIAGFRIDVSSVPAALQRGKRYTFSEIGVKLIREMTDGTETELPFDILEYTTPNNSYKRRSTDFFVSDEAGEVTEITLYYADTQATFRVTAQELVSFEMDLSDAKLTYVQYLDDVRFYDNGARFYCVENGVRTDVTDLCSCSSPTWDFTEPGTYEITVSCYRNGVFHNVGTMEITVLPLQLRFDFSAFPETCTQYTYYQTPSFTGEYYNGEEYEQLIGTFQPRFVRVSDGETFDYLPSDVPGVYQMYPSGIVNGKYLDLTGYTKQITVSSEDISFTLDTSQVVTEVEQWGSYSEYYWKCRVKVERNGEIEYLKARFNSIDSDGAVTEGVLDTSVPGVQTVQVYCDYHYFRVDMGTLDITVLPVNYEVRLEVYGYRTVLEQYSNGGYNFEKATLFITENGETTEKDVHVWLRYVDDDGRLCSPAHSIPTWHTGTRTIEYFTYYGGGRVYAEQSVEVTVVPPAAPVDISHECEFTVYNADQSCNNYGGTSVFRFVAEKSCRYRLTILRTDDTQETTSPRITVFRDGKWSDYVYDESTFYVSAGQLVEIACGAYKEDPTPDSYRVILSHIHSSAYNSEKPATCTEDGNIEYYGCWVCGKAFRNPQCTDEITENVIIPAGHTLEAHPAKAPTCTEDGNTAYWYCSVCRKNFNSEACTNQISLTDTVVNAHHTPTALAAKAASCTENGNIACWYCAACEKYYADALCAQQIPESEALIPAAHSLTFCAATEPTCENGGNIAYYVCGVCGDYFSDEAGQTKIENKESVLLAALTHNWGGWTKLNNSEHRRVCGNDPSHTETSAHTWDAGTVTVQPTCTEAGVKKIACTVCGAAKTEQIARTDHRDDNNDGLCDYGCGRVMGETPSEPSGGDDDNGGNFFTDILNRISAFFKSIGDFFRNLFKR